ncbi:MAG TPA: helix-turn-helix transcriptional regulator [Pyrinomonadaceae bacterium]
MKANKPKRLAEKLLQIRLSLGLSQGELIRGLGVEDATTPSYISEYETGQSEPPLLILLRYARVAGVSVDVLIDDELDLPVKLPAHPPKR